MPHASSQLSETELSQRILEMAKTGVYRESIFEAFQSFATKQQIRRAIAYTKQFGLHSVRHLRDFELGTYYQVDLTKYQSFQAALKAAVPLAADDDLAARILASTQAIQSLLAISGSFAMGFLVIGGFCLVTGHLQSGRLAWVSAASIGGIWLLQRACVRSLL
ncbi:MAG: hypothetical protein AAFW75_23850 [Cyanobacteria bacterium J06636_16]